MDVFGIRGLMTLDIGQVMINLDLVQRRIERFVSTATGLFDKIQASGMSSEFASLGKQVGVFALSATVMTKAFSKGFADIKQAGGEAFDYVGSRAEELTKKAITASSEMERFQRTTALFEKTRERTASVVNSTLNYAQASPFELKDVTRASLSLQSRGFRGDDVERYLKVAGELAAARGKGIDQMAEGLGRLKSNSAEGFRSLKTNAGISPEMLQKEGIALDSGGRLRIRNSTDTAAVLAAIERITQKMTGSSAATEQANTAAGKWTATINKATVLLSKFGDIIAPQVKAVIDKFSELLDYIDKLNPETKKTIANVVAFTGAAFALVTALGPVVAIVGTLASGFVAMGVGIVSAGFAINSLGLIMTSGLFTAGIANLANFIRNYTVARTVETAVPGAAAFTRVVTSASGRIFESVPGTAATTAASIAQVGVPGAAKVGDAVEKVGSKLTFVATGIGNIMTAIVNGAKTILGVITMPAMLAALATGFIVNLVIKNKEKEAIDEGKRLEKDSKLQSAQRAIEDYARYSKMGKNEQAEVLRNDPLFLDRIKERGKVIKAQDVGSAYYQTQEDEKKPLIRKQGVAVRGESGTEWVNPNAGRARTLDEYGNDVFTDYTEKGQAENSEALNKIFDLFPKKAKDNFNKNAWNDERDFNSGKTKRSKIEQQKYNEMEMESKKENPGKILTSQEILNQEKSYQEMEKMGMLSKAQMLKKQSEIYRLTEQSFGPDDEATRKSKLVTYTAFVSAIHQKMYDEVDVARNKDAANESLSVEKKLAYDKKRVKILKDNFISIEDFNKEYNLKAKKMPTGLEFGATSGVPFLSLEDQRANAEEYNRKLKKRILHGRGFKTDEITKEIHSGDASARGDQVAEQKDNFAFQANRAKLEGNSLQESLVNLRANYVEKIRLHEGNEKQIAQTTALYNLEKKKSYLEDFIAWRNIQQQKIDTDVKIKANRRGRELDRMKFDKSQYGEDNLEEQTKSVQKAADEQIKALKDKEVREAEILNKKIAVEESRRKPNSKKSQKQEDAEKDLYNLKNNTKDEIEAIKQNTGMTSEGNTEKKKGEDRDDEVKQRSLDLRKAEFKEQILQKKMAKAKTPEDLDKIARKQEEITKNEYKAELDILNLQTAKDLAAHAKDGAEQARITADYKLKEVELQEKYVQKLEDATTEMEKQKALLQSATDEKGKFTMGGIYNSYDEAMKGDQADSDLFSQRQNESGNTTDQMKRNKAAAVLGIPGTSPTDVFNSPVLATKTAADKDKYTGGYPTSNGNPYQNIKGKEWDKEHGVVEVKLYLNDKLQQTQSQPINKPSDTQKKTSMNYNQGMGSA